MVCYLSQFDGYIRQEANKKKLAASRVRINFSQRPKIAAARPPCPTNESEFTLSTWPVTLHFTWTGRGGKQRTWMDGRSHGWLVRGYFRRPRQRTRHPSSPLSAPVDGSPWQGLLCLVSDVDWCQRYEICYRLQSLYGQPSLRRMRAVFVYPQLLRG